MITESCRCQRSGAQQHVLWEAAGALGPSVSPVLHQKTDLIKPRTQTLWVLHLLSFIWSWNPRLVFGWQWRRRTASITMSQLNLPSTLGRAEMEVSRAPSPPAPSRRAALYTPDINLQSVPGEHAAAEGGGWRRARCWETNRDTQQHHVKVNRKTSHRCIRLLLRWQQRRVQGSAASVWGVISATQEEEEEEEEEALMEESGGFHTQNASYIYLFFLNKKDR